MCAYFHDFWIALSSFFGPSTCRFSKTLYCYCFNMAASDRVGRAHAIYPFVMIQLIVKGSRNFYTNKAKIVLFIFNIFDVNIQSSFDMKNIKTADFPYHHINQILILLCFIIVRNMTADTLLISCCIRQTSRPLCADSGTGSS